MRYTYKLKELAKELCEKSGCHHKCNDTKDCVVEDEALLLINENKSNNFDVKSNNLPSTLTNEDKVSVKDREIEEMAVEFAKINCNPKGCYTCNLYDEYGSLELNCEDYLYYRTMAETFYNAGYRKQSEGEWVRQKGSPEAICSNCGRDVVYQVIDNKWAFENYCPHCGARMRGEKQ